jgi:uncharacterized protein (TIRG00374 family)
VGLLWWALRDVELDELVGHMQEAHLGYFVAAVGVATITFPLRTARWRYLLRLEGQSLPFVPLWHATAIGFMANNLLPARAGEFARAYTAARLTGVQFSAALASVAVERIMDGIAMVALMTVAIITGGFAHGVKVGKVSLVGITEAAAVFFAVALTGAIAIVHRPTAALTAARWLLSRVLPARFATRAIGFVEGLLAGLDALRSPPRLAAVLGWSLAVWLTYAASFWLCFLAFDVDIPLSAPLLLQGLIGFGVALPSSPGFFGPFEAVTRATLAMYGIDAGTAVSFAVTYHLGTFVPISALGLWSLSRTQLSLADFKRGATPPAPPALSGRSAG